MTEPTHFTLKKTERLAHKTLIKELFEEGQSFVHYPFRVLWKTVALQSEYPAQLVISISKKRIRKAVKRNLLKRRIREIYRKNKHKLYCELKNKKLQIVFAIIYLSPKTMETKNMEKTLVQSIQQIPKEYEKHRKADRSVSHDFAD